MRFGKFSLLMFHIEPLTSGECPAFQHREVIQGICSEKEHMGNDGKLRRSLLHFVRRPAWATSKRNPRKNQKSAEDSSCFEKSFLIITILVP